MRDRRELRRCFSMTDDRRNQTDHSTPSLADSVHKHTAPVCPVRIHIEGCSDEETDTTTNNSTTARDAQGAQRSQRQDVTNLSKGAKCKKRPDSTHVTKSVEHSQRQDFTHVIKGATHSQGQDFTHVIKGVEDSERQDFTHVIKGATHSQGQDFTHVIKGVEDSERQDFTHVIKGATHSQGQDFTHVIKGVEDSQGQDFTHVIKGATHSQGQDFTHVIKGVEDSERQDFTHVIKGVEDSERQDFTHVIKAVEDSRRQDVSRVIQSNSSDEVTWSCAAPCRSPSCLEVPADSSHLSTVKATAVRLHLRTRTPSVSAWQAKWLGRSCAPPEFPVPAEVEGYVNKLTNERKSRINHALDWLRTELKDLQSMDQHLARQLLSLRQDIHQLRLSHSCQRHQELLDDVQSEMEEQGELNDLLDLPKAPLNDTPLQHLGVTRMNISARRFSTC